ncbi:hypothetical protein GCM10010346_51190 [Streptomyces chryseus]|uniref:Uncharacterized protein n=1 Tax=Streptomyces chryseus TaxID=68186 RepID=A0ABQ3E2E4_9ACTN|nr:hypothetical protein GCM10010346_51190 [Streptomyces chryseus]
MLVLVPPMTIGSIVPPDENRSAVGGCWAFLAADASRAASSAWEGAVTAGSLTGGAGGGGAALAGAISIAPATAAAIIAPATGTAARIRRRCRPPCLPEITRDS